MKYLNHFHVAGLEHFRFNVCGFIFLFNRKFFVAFKGNYYRRVLIWFPGSEFGKPFTPHIRWYGGYGDDVWTFNRDDHD